MSNEPDSTEILFCPHCALWYSRQTAVRELKGISPSGGLDEVFYCANANHKKRVELIDAHSAGVLTPWDEWKASQLIEQLRSHEEAAERIRTELHDYYQFEG